MHLIENLNKCNWMKEFPNKKTIKHSTIEVGIQVGSNNLNCHYPTQIHGNSIVKASDHTIHTLKSGRTNADGIYTDSPGLAIAVRTADCLPILLWDSSSQNTFAMALHAGWRGLTAGIITNGIEVIQNIKIPLPRIQCLLNPCIALTSFEIGIEVVEAFASRNLGLSDNQFNLAISKGVNDRWHADLALAGVCNLLNCGIPAENITVIRQCTYQKENNWPSFRREGKITRHIWSWLQT
ncbi:MAG: polyphenol oxidase family protein [Bdellovibrionota bacterium]